jgi:SNF2 family DNA or RNA helicase
LSKSKVVIDLIQNLDLQRVLILCPLSVVSVWPNQFDVHGDKDCQHILALDDDYTVKDKAKEVAEALTRTYACAVITNYESAWREPLSDILTWIEWDLVVLDESHRIKAPGGKASRFVCKLKATRKLCLTGTPMPHSPLDLYAQFRFLDPGVLGTSYVNFRARYAVMGGYENHQVIGFANQDELAAKFDSLAYRVAADDVLDLPPVQDIERTCALGKDARRVYEDLKAEMIAGVRSGVVTAANALVKLLRLQQISSGYVVDDEDHVIELDTAKRDLLRDVLEDLPPNEPVVVFGRFHHDLDMVHEVCESLERKHCELSGRHNNLASWQRGNFDVLAVQIQSGGVGVDLSRARYAIYLSVGYSLGDYQQSRARLHRPGQTRPVVYYHLIATNTIDRDVYRALNDKRDAVEVVLEGWR